MGNGHGTKKTGKNTSELPVCLESSTSSGHIEPKKTASVNQN